MSASYPVYIALQMPAHSAVGQLLTYAASAQLAPGTLVRVPLGRREMLGVVWDSPDKALPLPEGAQLRPVTSVLDAITPLPDAWRRLVAFAARYYQRSVGEIAMAALPPQLRELTPEQLARRLKPAKAAAASSTITPALVTLSAEQEQVIAQIAAGRHRPFLLYGSTGSG